MRRLILLFLLLWSYPAEAADSCESGDTWIERVGRENPNLPVRRREELPAAIVAKVTDQYNHTPPLERQVTANSAILLVGPGNGQVAPAIVGLFQDGCLQGTVTVTVPDGEGA